MKLFNTSDLTIWKTIADRYVQIENSSKCYITNGKFTKESRVHLFECMTNLREIEFGDVMLNDLCTRCTDKLTNGPDIIV